MRSERGSGGPVVVDLGAIAALGAEERRIHRYAIGFVRAMEQLHPGVVGRYLMSAGQQLPEDLAALIEAKVAASSAAGAIPESARVFHSLWVMDPKRPLRDVWPPAVEHLGLAFSANAYELRPLRSDAERRKGHGDRRYLRHYRARCEVLRQADALLASSPSAKVDLVELASAEPSAVAVVGSGEPWADVVSRAAEIFEKLAARGRRLWRTEPAIAFVSPFPPVPSGVARYSSRLVEALSSELDAVVTGSKIECFADGLDRVPDKPVMPPGHDDALDVRWLVAADRAVGGYDRVVYVLGNSEFHSGALAALRRRSGTVIAHDVRMTGLLRFSTDTSGAVPGGLDGALRRAYGDEVADAVRGADARPGPSQPAGDIAVADIAVADIAVADIDANGLFLLGDIVRDADQLLVSSDAARRLAVSDVGTELADRIGVLPFAMALRKDELAIVADARASRSLLGHLVVSFGIVDPLKLPQLLLRSAAQLQADADFELAFVGPVSDALATELTTLAGSLAMSSRLSITGPLERSAYLGYLGRATVAVQLRAGDFGEASAAVGDCLSAGVPTIVSDIGWMRDLPEDAVVKVDTSTDASANDLADALRSLLGDSLRRSEISRSASLYAADQTFARSAAALVAALGLSGREPAGSEKDQHAPAERPAL